MLKKELQQQLKRIEQTANAYFDKAVEKEAKEKASRMPWENRADFSFDDLNPGEQNSYSEILQDLADVVNHVLNATEHSSGFDESDQHTLREAIRFADAALRFLEYRRTRARVEHDEDRVLGFVSAQQWEEPTSIPSAREIFKESLEAIGRILMRVPDTGKILLVREAAKIADVDPKTIWRWAREPDLFPVIWNKDESRIKGIPEEPFREYRKGRYKNDS